MRIAKATEQDLELAMLVMGMIDDIQRGDYPRRADGTYNERGPDKFDADRADDCKEFVARLLAAVTPRAAGGALIRVVGGMHTVLHNEVFDPASDVLTWHPDLLPAIEERQRRRAIEKAKADRANWQVIDWQRRDGSAFRHDFIGYAPGHYITGSPDHGWVLRYKEGGGDITWPQKAPRPTMEPVKLFFNEREEQPDEHPSSFWIWVDFGKETP
jgi:hypothetical protein